MILDLLIPFFAIGLAELGDKTQLAVILLSSRTRDHLQLLIGIFLAFLIVDGAAVLVGSLMTYIIPISFLRIFSGIVFIVFGILILKGGDGKFEERLLFKSAFLSGFTLIFITEWGDKTQIAAALFASEYNTMMVLIGTMAALTLVSLAAIYLGKIISNKINRKVISRVAGITFIIIGFSFLLFHFIVS
jgi:putative Ca2+/H+ antiporter (TMEM165/GDT1 family)